MTEPSRRIAGAPISWGVCEAPGWGHEMTSDRVLSEMAGLGLAATELGPAGYLGSTAAAVRTTLDGHGLGLVGGFVPVPMHIDPQVDLAEADDAMAILAESGAGVVVLAARSGDGSYDRRVVLDSSEWDVLFANLQRLQRLAGDHGLRPTLHPHVGTAVEDRDSVLRVLQGSDIDITLDTGHLLIGGMEPLELLDLAAERVAHVHLKDVDATVAETVANGATAYIDGVRAGLYRPLGQGDVDIAGVVDRLDRSGFSGWYVLEQDCALPGEPALGTGPAADVRHSLDYLAALPSPATQP